MKFLNFIFIGVLIVLAIFLWNTFSAKQVLQSQLSNALTSINGKDKEIKKWKDAAGYEHTTAKTIRLNKQTAEILLQSKLDSVNKELGIKTRNINQLHALMLETHGTIEPTVIMETRYVGDTPNKWKFTGGDSVWVKIDGDGIIQNNFVKSFKLRYNIKDSIQITSYTKYPLFSRPKSFIDVKLLNKNTHVMEQTIYTLYQKPKRWGIGVQCGVGISSEMNVVNYIGVGISYNLIRF